MTDKIEPEIGMMVNFGSLLIEGELHGVITEITKTIFSESYPIICKVKLDLFCEGGNNETVHEVGGCVFYQTKPKEVISSYLQYCYPRLLAGFPMIISDKPSKFQRDIVLGTPPYKEE